MSQSRVELSPHLAIEVLGYFLRHQHAADSLEGVVRWRLEEERIHHTADEVGAAVTWLVERGYLVLEPIHGGQPVFRLDATKCRAAEHLLRRRASSRSRG